MQTTLAMEKAVNQCLLDLHKLAKNNGDPHVCSILFYSVTAHYTVVQSVVGVMQIRFAFECASVIIFRMYRKATAAVVAATAAVA